MHSVRVFVRNSNFNFHQHLISFNKLSEIRRSLDMKMNSNGMFTVYDVIYGKKILSQTKPIVVKGFFSLVKDSVSKSSDVEQNDVPETARSSSAQPTVTEELAISSRLIEKTHESRLRKKVFGLFLSKNDAKFSVDGTWIPLEGNLPTFAGSVRSDPYYFICTIEKAKREDFASQTNEINNLDKISSLRVIEEIDVPGYIQEEKVSNLNLIERYLCDAVVFILGGTLLFFLVWIVFRLLNPRNSRDTSSQAVQS